MASTAFAVRLLEGGTDVLRRAAQEINGTRQTEYREFLKRAGVTAERWFLQQTPIGAMMIVYLEAEDIPKMFRIVMESREPFDVWFKQMAKEAHGIDLNKPPQGPFPELIHDAQIGP